MGKGRTSSKYVCAEPRIMSIIRDTPTTSGAHQHQLMWKITWHIWSTCERRCVRPRSHALLRVGGSCEKIVGAYGIWSDHEERRVEDGDVIRALHLVDQAYTAPKRGTDSRTTTARPRAGCHCRRSFN